LAGEIASVGAMTATFVKERPLPDRPGEMREVTTDDAFEATVRFASGAVGTLEASKVATGRKNQNTFEINGSGGSVVFDLERLNELQYYSRGDEGTEQGFRTILVTDSVHPYLTAWWPPGHIIGWEHTFIHEVRDLLLAIDKGEPVYPDFYDGLRCQQVLDAALKSADERRWVEVPSEE
ncbi:MAG: Gfo/Idh/MocA family oxidoreductase, partial [Anaerolineae bacterium]